MTSSCHGGARWSIDTYFIKNGHWKWLKFQSNQE